MLERSWHKRSLQIARNRGLALLLEHAATLPSTRPRVASSQILVEAPRSVATVGLPQAKPSDLANMMSAAIEAALTPITQRLEATILPMQRTLESLQAEFVALRSEEKGDDAADAKRMRTDADM